MIRLTKLMLFSTLICLSMGCDECKSIKCQNSGFCENGECICPTGTSGEHCDQEDQCATLMLDCGDFGRCVDGVCVCEDGFSGPGCEHEDRCITNPISCQNGGICEDGACKCSGPYRGTHCEIYDECVQMACHYNQPCADGECDCNEYTFGELCEFKEIDIHIDKYEGFWNVSHDFGGASNYGSLEITAYSTNYKLLDAQISDFIYTNTMVLEFIPPDFEHFNVIRVNGSSDCIGGGDFVTGKLNLEFTFQDEVQGQTVFKFEEH